MESVGEHKPTKNNKDRNRSKRKFKVNKPLIPLKLILFCWYGAASCLLPYQTIHMRQLGITVEETAIIYTFLPFTQIFGPPVAGMIADRLGRYKPVLLVNLILCVVFSTITLLVPTIPPSIKESRSPILQNSLDEGLQVSFDACDDYTECNIYKAPSKEKRERLNVVVLYLSECDYSCANTPEKHQDHQHLDDISCNSDSTESKCHRRQNLARNVTLFARLIPQYLSNNKCLYSAHLVGPQLNSNLYRETLIVQQEYESFIKNETNPHCVLSCPLRNLTYEDDYSTPVLTNPDCIIEPDRQLTFWLYFVIRVLFQTALNVCFALLDATALALVEHHESQFGRQRFWAILATAIFSPVTGIAIDFISDIRAYEDYSPAYYFFDILVIATAVFAGTLSISVAPPEKNVLRNVCKLLRLPEVLAFMIVVFCLGTIWGFIESFLFWYLLDLGSPKYLLGLTLTASAVAGLPFLHHSEWFVKKIGRVNLLIIALLVYFIRCFGYSYIKNPWWCIPFEGMEVLTYHLMWIAAATYSANLVPKGLLATIQGCVGGLHFGIGRGVGSLVGGNIMHFAGARMAFRIMGISGGVVAVLYSLVYYTVLRKCKGLEETKKRQLEEELAKENEMECLKQDADGTSPKTMENEIDTPPSLSMLQNEEKTNCELKTKIPNSEEFVEMRNGKQDGEIHECVV